MPEGRRGLLVFGHPLHPLLTHFPMALWPLSLFWDLLGWWSGNPLWWNLSFWSIAIGLIFALLAAISGLIDYATIPQDSSVERIASRHMLIMMIAFAIYTGDLLVRLSSPVPAGSMLVYALLFSVIGTVVLVIGGWYGGELVYRHGVGTSAALSNHKEQGQTDNNADNTGNSGN